MSMSHAVRERLVLDRLRETYEQNGYEFFLEPSATLLPPFLKGYRPDAIALKGVEGVVIEVKFGNHPIKDQRLQALAAILRDRSEWSLKVYMEQQRPEDRLSIDVPTVAQLENLISESEILAAEGHPRAAFLLARSGLEAVARARASEQGLAIGRPISPAGTVESLEMGGLINDETGRDLRKKAQLRNRVAHGDLTALVERSAVDGLIQCVRDLSAGKSTLPEVAIVA